MQSAYKDTQVIDSHTGERLRVVMVSKAMVTGAYQRKAEEIAAAGIDLTVFTPPYWSDRRGAQVAESVHTRGYTLRTLPTRRIGDYHLHHYPSLSKALAMLRPHVLHMDEEPYNLATWLALRAAAKYPIASTFFTWQNIDRRYPLPFRQIEQANYRMAPVAIAGSHDAADVLRAKGYGGEIAIIPQFGVDPDLYHPEKSRPPYGPLRIGYAGALLPEKGVDLLLRACATLDKPWSLTLIGDGEEAANLRSLAVQLDIEPRIHFLGRQPSASMPALYREMDVLVLPSRTLPNWKEQFGRVLVEAMACGVVPICSDSGEMARVIGDAGMVFCEEDWHELAAELQRLADSPDLRMQYAVAGRARVLAHYTMSAVAQQSVEVYARLAATRRNRIRK